MSKATVISGNRKTALALVLAILAVELLASKQLQGAWSGLWSPTIPLGSGMSGTAPTSSSGGNGGSPTAPPGTKVVTGGIAAV